MTLSKGSFLFRLFGKQNQAEAPTPKIAYCIPIAVMDHALFDEGAPLADITPDEKRDMTKAIGERPREHWLGFVVVVPVSESEGA